MGRRKRKKSAEDVELNLAAMLDMAFQLLTFFILTFHPAPVEGQVSLRLPPPQAVATKAANAQPAGDNADNKNAASGVNTLVISVFADREGPNQLVSYAVGEGQVATLGGLDQKLKTVFADEGNPFDQVIIQATSNLTYEKLMEVVEVCTRQTLPNGQKLSKLSFVEVPTSGG
jgi:biopolymer transport protein ExbD